METKIEYSLDEQQLRERIHMMISNSGEIRKNKIIAYASLPCMLFTLFYIVITIYLQNEMILLCPVLLAILIFLFWYGIWGTPLKYRRLMQKGLAKREFPLEQTLTFTDVDLKLEGKSGMYRLRWEHIPIVYENEHYWMFGKYIVVDKRILTDEQLAFLKEKQNGIKRKKRCK